MTENEIARIIVDAAYYVHKRPGPGLLESVYETILAYELKRRGLKVKRQVLVAVVYDNIKFDEGFRVNFGAELIRDGISRVVNVWRSWPISWTLPEGS